MILFVTHWQSVNVTIDHEIGYQELYQRTIANKNKEQDFQVIKKQTKMKGTQIQIDHHGHKKNINAKRIEKIRQENTSTTKILASGKKGKDNAT